ncbi:pilus assembly protein PilY [Geoanaerobacter pelophilus]|uniref:Pilus assembly protein PilY n=1 Tax=Geoanaerobacter pelophilus TaxID=60036 RepID=A0ABQ0MF08_9BACT|nr:pilus assembly protein PilY [Geoanaerobacter pelophilus]
MPSALPRIIFLLCILNLCLLATAGRLLAADSFPGLPWCSVPPSAGAGVKPNLLLMLDNSGSLYDLAYTDPSAYCIDDTYSNANSYPGYFEEGTVYSYDFTSGSFKASAGTLPAGCDTVDNGYLCAGMAPAVAPAKNRTVNRFLASGRFLNWLTMSKLDLEKKVLTGGKYMEVVPNSGVWMLLAESRGCRGEKYMKITSDAPQVTFAVRGPAATDPDYLDAEHAGGLTKIEVYDKQYNVKECAKAVSDFQAGNKNLLRKGGANCLGESNWWEGKSQDGKDIPSAYKTYNDAMANCFLDPTKVFNPVIAGDCNLRIYNIYHQQPERISLIPGAYDRICGRNIKHPRYLDESGYLGEFWDGHGISGGVGAENEAREFCREAIKKAPATDPLDSASMSGNMEVPAYLLELGLLNLGAVTATLQARISVPSAPSGVIQEFASAINFGAMIFNDSGAASECKVAEEVPFGAIPCLKVKHCLKSGVDSGSTCVSSADCDPGYGCVELPAGSDGGRIAAAVDTNVGDHSSGLIATLDRIRADAWTPLAESFYNAMGYFSGRTDMRLQSGDFVESPSNYSCQKNNVLILTDGTSSADRHKAVNDFVADAVTRWGNGGGMPDSETTVSGDPLPLFQGSYNLDDLAWVARNKNLRDFSQPLVNNKDFLSTYVVYTGPPCASRDKTGTCLGDESVAEKMMQLTALNGGGKIANAQDLEELEKALRGMMQDIAGGSGTSPAMLSTGERNGALYLQDEFHPLKSFDGGKTSAAWIGEMQALWYYIDPLLGSMTGEGSTVREDTPEQKTLKLKENLVVNFVYDSSRNQSHAYLLKDSNGDGIADSNPAHEDRFITDQPAEVSPDDLRSLWRAGRSLWLRSSLHRTIYTQFSGELAEFTSTGLDTSSNRGGIIQLLQAENAQEADDVINYVRGANIPGYRSRSVVVPGVNQDHASVWKLGDIISSSPQMQSAVPLGSYHLPAPRGYGDTDSYGKSYGEFIGTDSYKARGMVYVGANDGMLHAFRLGTLAPNVTGDTVARLEGDSLGREEWAFIPKNALPYLKYLGHPNYRHLYYVDGGLTLADVQIGSGAGSDSWRTVLIGGMGLGGASCDGGTDCAKGTEWVDLPSATAAKKVGYSSYFALDVTEPEKPKLLWEFSDPRLGFATAGSAILRSGDKWFAVLGSGPTGPIETASQQFLGRSSQPLRFFVLDLATGTLLRTIDTGIAEAFAGSLSGGGIDADKWHPFSPTTNPGNYQDDALYVGYTKRLGTKELWSDGGVGRIATKESSNPADWVWNPLMDGIGPVTSGVARLQDRSKQNLWLFFGGGRYFFKEDDLKAPENRRLALYGVKEPCYPKVEGTSKQDRFDSTCLTQPGEKTKVLASALVDQSSGPLKLKLEAEAPGWRIDLDQVSGGLGDERLITTPTTSTSGAVFFSTFKPSYDPCQFGASSLWRVYYSTGAFAPDGLIKGRALVRVATGALQPMDLGGGFTQRENRRTGGVDGKPGGIKLVTNSGLRPLKKIIHIQER